MVYKSAHQRRSVVALNFANSNCDMTQNFNQPKLSNSKRLGDMFFAPNYLEPYLNLTHCHLNSTQVS